NAVSGRYRGIAVDIQLSVLVAGAGGESQGVDGFQFDLNEGRKIGVFHFRHVGAISLPEILLGVVKQRIKASGELKPAIPEAILGQGDVGAVLRGVRHALSIKGAPWRDTFVLKPAGSGGAEEGVVILIKRQGAELHTHQIVVIVTQPGGPDLVVRRVTFGGATSGGGRY